MNLGKSVEAAPGVCYASGATADFRRSFHVAPSNSSHVSRRRRTCHREAVIRRDRRGNDGRDHRENRSWAGRQHGVIALPVRSNDSAVSSNAGRVFEGYRPEISAAPNGRFRTVGQRIWRVRSKILRVAENPSQTLKTPSSFLPRKLVGFGSAAPTTTRERTESWSLLGACFREPRRVGQKFCAWPITPGREQMRNRERIQPWVPLAVRKQIRAYCLTHDVTGSALRDRRPGAVHGRQSRGRGARRPTAGRAHASRSSGPARPGRAGRGVRRIHLAWVLIGAGAYRRLLRLAEFLPV